MKKWQDIAIHEVSDVRMPPVETGALTNGTPLFLVGGSFEPVLHLEIIFGAGRAQASRPLVAGATAAVLPEGTDTRSGESISESIEVLGSTLRTSAGMDALTVNLYCLSRHFEASLAIVSDILLHANFPEHELEAYRSKRLHELRISSRKNEYLAGTRLMHALFPMHPYGYIPTPETVRDITRGDLFAHRELLGAANMRVFLSGEVTGAHVALLEKHLGAFAPGKAPASYDAPAITAPTELRIDGPQQFQSSIRIGRRIVHRNHEDYPGLFLLNTILGDYFGSRLMRNIREDKGLTYHIASSLETLARGACLVIGTEAAIENTDRVIEEISRELRQLQNEPVSAEELRMVRNYIMGNLMMQLDGPLKSMDVVKTLVLEDARDGWFDDFVTALNQIGPEDLQELARKYLNMEDMHLVVVA